MQWRYIDVRTITESEYEKWYATADEARRTKCGAFRQQEDRLCAIAGDHLARTGVAEACGVDPASIQFARTEAGKPYAIGLDVHFNISHSRHYVVCGVSERPIGIDVEQLRPIRAKLTQKVCTPEELVYIQEAPGWGVELTGEAMRRFFRVWTTKEAYFKWAGTGITDLKSFDTLDHISNGGTFELDGYMVSIFETKY